MQATKLILFTDTPEHIRFLLLSSSVLHVLRLIEIYKNSYFFALDGVFS